MSNKNSKTSWVVFGAGNMIFDIIDTIEINGGTLTNIVANETLKPHLAKKLNNLVINIEDFVPQDNQKYIFGFVNPNKQAYLKILKKHNIVFSNLIHTRAYLSKGMLQGVGNYYGAGVVIGANTAVGNFNYFNRGALVGHDVKVGDYNHFGPGSIICGRASVKSRCTFGAGSVVNDGLKISSDVTIGSLGAVINDIDKNGVYVGVPVRKIKEASLLADQ